MITEQAIVTRCLGDRVELELQRQSACGGCEMSKGCGVGALGRLLGRRGRPLLLENTQGLRKGDSVMLGLSEQILVKASLLIYGLPLLAMILLGFLAGLYPGIHESLVILAALAGFFGGFKLASALVNSSVRTHLTPWIVETGVNPGTNSGS